MVVVNPLVFKMNNFFELFNLPISFRLSQEDLEHHWKVASSQVHPDKFATASPAEKRMAMQWSTRINEAYATLKDPLKRATYICQLQGVSIDAETNTAMSAEFLMKQMQWRESLEEAQVSSSKEVLLKDLEREVRAEYDNMEQALCRNLEQGAYTEAAALIRKLMFLNKLLDEVALISP